MEARGWFEANRFQVTMLIVGVCMGLAFPLILGPFLGLNWTQRALFALPCVAAGLVVGFINYRIGKAQLLDPLRSLHEASVRARSGDFSMSLSLPDALGEVRQSTEDLIGLYTAIQKLLKELGQVTRQVRESLGGISGASGVFETSSQQVAEGIQRVSESAEQQAGVAVRVSQGVVELSEQQGAVLERIRTTTLRMGKESTEVARQGSVNASQVIKEIEGVLSSVQQTTIEVQNLDRESQEIGKIVQVISRITAQTNLLALNAAIEAARAGEQGKGFAVVAEEIRRLAEQSSRAAKQIAEIVKQIQARIAGVVGRMSTSTESVAGGRRIAAEVDGILAHIVGEIELLAEEITAAVSSAAALDTIQQEVRQGVRSMADAARENAETSEKVSLAAQRQVNAIGNLTLSTNALYEIGDRLQQLGERFRAD